jgi:hypothetical protein
MKKIIKFTFIPIAICVLLVVNLSVTNDKNEFFLGSCVTVVKSAEASIYGPGSILNRHELVYEYPEMWDAGIVAICSGWGIDCAIEGEVS